MFGSDSLVKDVWLKLHLFVDRSDDDATLLETELEDLAHQLGRAGLAFDPPGPRSLSELAAGGENG